MTMITPSYLGETIEYSSLHACRSTLEDPTRVMQQHSNTRARLSKPVSLTLLRKKRLLSTKTAQANW